MKRGQLYDNYERSNGHPPDLVLAGGYNKSKYKLKKIN